MEAGSGIVLGNPAIDAVPLQILLNEQNSLITTNLMANETPRLLYNKLAIKSRNFSRIRPLLSHSMSYQVI